MPLRAFFVRIRWLFKVRWVMCCYLSPIHPLRRGTFLHAVALPLSPQRVKIREGVTLSPLQFSGTPANLCPSETYLSTHRALRELTMAAKLRGLVGTEWQPKKILIAVTARPATKLWLHCAIIEDRLFKNSRPALFSRISIHLKFEQDRGKMNSQSPDSCNCFVVSLKRRKCAEE